MFRYSDVSMRHTRFQNSLPSLRHSAGSDVAEPASGRRPRERGFTIVEVMLATFVMSFGIATSIIALQTGFKAIDVARDQTLASQIMQSEIERLRLWPWSKSTPASVVDSITELPAFGTVPLAST